MAGSVNWAAVISILVATSISRCVATTANAQTQHDRCAGKEGGAPDLRMAGCTAAIESKAYIGKKLAHAFTPRVGLFDKAEFRARHRVPY